jgi:hypothetical protein
MVSLEFFPVSLWPWCRLSLKQKWVPGLFPGGKGGRCVRLTTLRPSYAVVMKSGTLNFLEPSGPLQACNGTALPFYYHNCKYLVAIRVRYRYCQIFKEILTSLTDFRKMLEYQISRKRVQWDPKQTDMTKLIVDLRNTSNAPKISTFCLHCLFMCFVWISEQTAIISLYSINCLVFITETKSVYARYGLNI